MSNSQIARNLLEKYGWKEGSGLGRNEDGMSEAIKVFIKQDKTGVGHDPGKEFTDHWWMRAFNDAAKKIDQPKAAENIDSKKKEQQDRKALFYSQFKKSSTTLANGVEEKVEQADDSESSDNEDTALKSKGIPTLEEIHKFCGGATGHKAARFGIKMTGKLERAQKQEKQFEEKQQRLGDSPSPQSISTEEDTRVATSLPVTEDESNCADQINQPNESCTKKKKKKKSKRKHQDVEEEQNSLAQDANVCSSSGASFWKGEETLADVATTQLSNDGCDLDVGIDISSNHPHSRKKSKKKKKEKERCVDVDNQQELVSVVEVEAQQGDRPSETCVQNEPTACVDATETSCSHSKSKKKNKRKKKRDNDSGVELKEDSRVSSQNTDKSLENVTSVSNDLECTKTESKKRKKEKKNPCETVVEAMNESCGRKRKKAPKKGGGGDDGGGDNVMPEADAVNEVSQKKKRKKDKGSLKNASDDSVPMEKRGKNGSETACSGDKEVADSETESLMKKKKSKKDKKSKEKGE